MADEWPVEHNEARRRFEVALGDEQAVLNYYLRGDAMVITHTWVPSVWEGRGIAASLTRAALKHARGQGLSVVPVCSYTAAFMRRYSEYSDLRKSD